MGDTRKKTNELIRRRKRKKLIKKIIIFSILAIIALTVFLLKHPYFNIIRVEVTNNKLLDKGEIESLSNVNLGSNIFYLNKNEIRKQLLSNPYISNVKIHRKLPSTVELEIIERKPQYYIFREEDYIIVDTEGVALESVLSLDAARKDSNVLVELTGLDISEIKIGEKVSNDNKKIEQLQVFSDLIQRNISDTVITAINLESDADIKVYFKDIMVKVGNINNMESKLNDAINIITQKNLADLKGYIDISFDGDPVMSIEK
ncbi:MAG: FtsQ-type POTRA domain-containing protein [Clostridiales bacterium]|uniref:cell division protein FtsQ/DivIB n=1 Tax=Clostridium sp. N3C TaxID=1776758 RepID=UPI00092DEDC2|nr:FtsQ-type POTRA domain-containing protein [Clostridium sp. N3C]NLZ47331.1 FtsQ-type POTRA domain-containing protein [Clostridiales bacterium]SCN21346.1 Division initiation protein DivIB [Clostridium sp. N3C]